MKAFHNSLGMDMLPIPAGSFMMGSDISHPIDGPAHRVTLTQPFYMAATPVTNSQYEQYQPSHRSARAQVPFSRGDDDAVLFVSYTDATAFAAWLSDKEGKHYMLPTEAQWEYAAKGGKNELYTTGDRLADACYQNQRESWYPDIDHYDSQDECVRLTVGQTPANAFGLMDMNGLVEEWCEDRFVRYADETVTDPLGRSKSPFRMTRGGSHSTPVEYLRNDTRMGQLDEDRSWIIGFRLICMDETRIETPYERTETLPLWAKNVSQDQMMPSARVDSYFSGPQPFVKLTVNDAEYLHSHNHGPSVVECPNGDLLVAWFSCPRESGREMSILASRKRRGAAEWEPASVFLASPARNLSCTQLIRSGNLIYHINGFSACATWANGATAIRYSQDSGATWTDWEIVQPRHDHIIMSCDHAFSPEGRLLISADNISVDNSVSGTGGSSYFWWDGEALDMLPGETPGIHAPVEILENGTILSFGRGSEIEGNMVFSQSTDGGKTFQVQKSIFPGIGQGQRAVLKKLEDGTLFFASFASGSFAYPGGIHTAEGLFGALSYDGGKTWPVVKPIVPEDADGEYNGGAWTGTFRMDQTHAEPRGYLTCTIAADGCIHLLSSGLAYAFSQSWLERPLTKCV